MHFLRETGFAGLASLCLVATASAQFGSEPAKLDLVQVRDDIYVIHNDGVPGNITVLVTDAGVLMVDNKFPIDYDNVMTMLRSITDQPVKYVIDTHFHGDHTGNNAALQAEGAQVIAAANARAKMVEDGLPGLPDITIEDHLRLYLGGVPVDAYTFGRSHTDGDVVVHFPDHGVIAMGDMFTHGVGVPQLIDYAGGGSARAWTHTLDQALKLDFDTVVPGHGLLTSREVLEAFRDDTLRLQEMVRAMNRAGRSAADIEAMMRSEFGWQDFHVERSLAGLLVELQ
jgi:cyclase